MILGKIDICKYDKKIKKLISKYNEADTPLFMSAVYKCYINE